MVADDARVSDSQLLMIHGANHHAALLEPVAARVREHDWHVHTPAIAGHEPEVAPDPGVTLADMVGSVRDYIEARDLTDLTIYAHSAGGILLTQLAPQVRHRLKRLVFHNAIVLPDGRTLLEDLPPQVRELIAACTDEQTRSFTLPFPVWREAFIQDADLAAAEAAYRELIPEPLATYETKVDQRAFFDLVSDPAHGVPASFILGTADAAFPPGQIPGVDERPLNGWGWLRHIRRLGSPRMVEIAEATHEIMFTNPGLLATKIHAAARD